MKMSKLNSKIILLLVIAIALLYATFALASPGILASGPRDGTDFKNWEIFLIDPVTGDAKNLTNNPGDD